MLDIAISTLTGRQHHFKLAIRYTPDRNRAEYYAERVLTVWMRERRCILNEREIRKMVGEGLVSNIPRYQRNNGGIDIREAYYLGRFKLKLEAD